MAIEKPVKVSAEYEKARQEWKDEWNTKITEWEKTRFLELSGKIEENKNEISVETKQKYEQFKKNYQDFKKHIALAEKKTETEWEQFKDDISKKAERISDDANDLLRYLDKYKK